MRAAAVALLVLVPVTIATAETLDCLDHVAVLHLPGQTEESGFTDLVVKGLRAYAIGDYYDYYGADDVLQVIDLTAPESPVLRGQVPISGNGTDQCLAAIDHYALVGGHELLVIDVEDEDQPQVVATMPWAASIVDLVVSQRLAYAVESTGTVAILDVDAPDAPVRLGEIQPPFEARAVALTAGRLVVAGDGLLFDPATPTLQGWTPVDRDLTWGYPCDVELAGGHVYTANLGDYYDFCYLEGFHVYRGTEPASPPHLDR